MEGLFEVVMFKAVLPFLLILSLFGLGVLLYQFIKNLLGGDNGDQA